MDAKTHREAWDQEQVLDALLDIGKPATVGRLAEHAGIGPGSVEIALRRLTAKRRVERCRVPRSPGDHYRLLHDPPPGGTLFA